MTEREKREIACACVSDSNHAMPDRWFLMMSVCTSALALFQFFDTSLCSPLLHYLRSQVDPEVLAILIVSEYCFARREGCPWQRHNCAKQHCYPVSCLSQWPTKVDQSTFSSFGRGGSMRIATRTKHLQSWSVCVQLSGSCWMEGCCEGTWEDVRDEITVSLHSESL